jgi:hypothetical protein
MSKVKAAFNMTNSMLCWKHDGSAVKLFPWPDTERISREYQMSSFACWAFVRKLSPKQRQLFALSEALRLIIYYRCDPEAVHEALLELQEYQDFLQATNAMLPEYMR